MEAPQRTKEYLKKNCSIDLTFPYHRDEGLPARLTDLTTHLLQSGVSKDNWAIGHAASSLEEKLAEMFGKPAAMWCPTGTMAQGIAARLYAEKRGKKNVILHATSHLVLHEKEAYSVVHGLDAEIVGGWRETLKPNMLHENAACAFIEMPQRHSGGLLPNWDELNALKEQAASLKLPLHMDGARLWSCRPFYENKPLAEIVDGFSSLYVSFYKDIGATTGAALIGEKDFIEEARAWCGRLGGLFVDPSFMTTDTLRLLDKRLPQMEGFVRAAKDLANAVDGIDGIEVSPKPPQVNMFHILLPCYHGIAEQARDIIAEKTGIWLSNRFWNYEGDNQCAMEVSVGEKAAAVSTNVFADAVSLLVQEIKAKSQCM